MPPRPNFISSGTVSVRGDPMRHEEVSLITKVSRVLGVDLKRLEAEAVREYLEAELRKVRAEVVSIMAKYGVKSLEELDAKIRSGELKESDVFYDFTKLDFLLDREERLRKLLEEICHNRGKY